MGKIYCRHGMISGVHCASRDAQWMYVRLDSICSGGTQFASRSRDDRPEHAGLELLRPFFK